MTNLLNSTDSAVTLILHHVVEPCTKDFVQEKLVQFFDLCFSGKSVLEPSKVLLLNKCWGLPSGTRLLRSYVSEDCSIVLTVLCITYW